MKWKLLIGALVILAGFFFTNPDMDDYRDFLVEDLKERSIKGTSLEEVADTWLGDAATLLINRTTDHSNYFFFSIYETSILGLDLRYIGVGTMFIDVSDEETSDESGNAEAMNDHNVSNANGALI